METVILLSIVLGYLFIGTFMCGIMSRTMDWSWTDGSADEGIYLLLVIVFWPLLLPLLLTQVMYWLGQKLVTWCTGVDK